MKTLTIETSTKKFSLATSNGDKILKRRSMILSKVLSSSIIPAIDRILKDSKLNLQSLDAFVVGLGPGSFTSLRVGLSTIKGLAFAAEKPIIGIPSLDAIASNVLPMARKSGSQICVLCDARRNLVYGCVYAIAKGKLKRKSEYLLTALPDLLDRINGNTIFVGDAVLLYRPNIEIYFSTKDSKFNVVMAQAKYALPDAKNLVVLAQESLTKKKFANIDKLVPLYLYPKDCQVTSQATPVKSSRVNIVSEGSHR